MPAHGRSRRSPVHGAGPLLLAVLLLILIVAAGCGSSATSSGGSASETAPMKLKVLEYNIEYGGALVSLEKTEDAIRLADPDVAGIEESYTNLPKIAKATGYPYYNSSLQILSKYPIWEPSGGEGLYAFIEVRPGYVIAFCNIHLDYVFNAQAALAHGKSLAYVLTRENVVRGTALNEQYRVLPQLAAQGYPVFLTGDFNEPSSLDYVEATVGTRRQITQVVPWPVSARLLALGFRDSYREAHPDPVTDPGVTWPAARPKVAAWAGNPTAKDFRDRIDYVYTAGPSKTQTSVLVAEKGAPGVAMSVTPWTSDHRAVLSTFEVTPHAMPLMVGVNARLLREGDTVGVVYRSPQAGGHVALLSADGAKQYESRVVDGTDGQLQFETRGAGRPAGGYQAVLSVGDKVVASVPFWLRARHPKVQLSTDKQAYSVGEPIVVNWADGPANRWDWISVYRADASDPNVDSYLVWDYTGLHASGTTPPKVDGTLTLGGDSQGGPWPLPPGRYVVLYLLTDAYTSAGSSAFTVTK